MCGSAVDADDNVAFTDGTEKLVDVVVADADAPFASRASGRGQTFGGLLLVDAA